MLQDAGGTRVGVTFNFSLWSFQELLFPSTAVDEFHPGREPGSLLTAKPVPRAAAAKQPVLGAGLPVAVEAALPLRPCCRASSPVP